jgi:hypothetical protein
MVEIRHRSQLVRLAAQRIEQAHHVAGAMVVDVVGLEHLPRELLEVVILLVGGVV